jgi:hypothetical protein
MLVPPYEFESRAQSASSEAIVLRQLNVWLKPELRFSFNVVDMHMGTEFLPREKEEPKTLLAEDRRAHEDILHLPGILAVTEIFQDVHTRANALVTNLDFRTRD